MKNKEVIYRVRNTIKEENKDSRLSNKHIANILKTTCSFLLNREINKSLLYQQSEIWQTLCVEMIQVSSLECLDIPSDCKIWRSKTKLPTFLSVSDGFMWKSISSMDSSVQFFLTTPRIAYSKSKLKYNKNKYVWIENGYLYSLSSFPMIKVVGYFDNDINGSGCSKLSDEFRCPLYLLDAVIKMTIQELSMYKQITEDIVQNKTNIS